VLQTARATIGLPVAALALWCATAQAERPHLRLTLQPLYTLAFVDQRDPSGGGVGADLALELSAAVALRVSGFVSWQAASGRPLPSDPGAPAFGPAGTIASFGAFAGITYALPVLRIVPAFDLGLGVLGLRGDARFDSGADAAALASPITAFAVELGFGVDWLITRRWAIGGIIRYHALLTELTRAPSFLYLGPRASVRF
jgi:hypothetical protein